MTRALKKELEAALCVQLGVTGHTVEEVYISTRTPGSSAQSPSQFFAVADQPATAGVVTSPNKLCSNCVQPAAATTATSCTGTHDIALGILDKD